MIHNNTCKKVVYKKHKKNVLTVLALVARHSCITSVETRTVYMVTSFPVATVTTTQRAVLSVCLIVTN